MTTTQLFLQGASVTGLARVILIVLLIYLVYRFLVVFLFPLAMKAYLRRVQKEFFNQNPHLREQERKREGEVTIEHTPTRPGSRSKDDGEYVEYKEIKD